MVKAVRGKTQRDFTKANIKKLQKAGLLGPVDLRKKIPPEVIRRMDKYRGVLTGKSAVVKAPDLATARRLRKTLGLPGTGTTIVVPKEKGETYTFRKSTDEIVSTRKGYNPGETIKKTLGGKFPSPPSQNSGKRLYYTIPERTRGTRKLKRHTFASFDEMLFYMSKYEISFDDIEDRIEIEEISKGSRIDKARQTKIHDERAKRTKRAAKKKAAKKKPAPRKRAASNKGSRGRGGQRPKGRAR